MFDRNSLLIVALCATLGLLVVGVGVATFSFYQSGSSSAFSEMESTLANELSAVDRSANTRTPRPLESTVALTRAHSRMQELQTMLDRKSRLLEMRTTRLTQKTVECKALQEQLDDSIATVLEMLEGDTGAGNSEVRQLLGSDLEKELKQLKAELERSESLELEQMQQVVQLRSDLAATEVEIAELRKQTNDELLSLLEHQQVLDATARRAFTRLGSVAVPVLVESLGDENADVRIWAASVLGDLGADGQDAVPALMGMLIDTDKLVRDQAKRSLDQLSN
jgi:chromosome segregation ATPase